MTSRPVLIMTAVLAGANTFVAGTAFIEQVPRGVAGLAALTVSAATIGWGVYTQGKVTPDVSVAVREIETETGERVLVAGHAGPVDEGKEVDVTEASRTQWA